MGRRGNQGIRRGTFASLKRRLGERTEQGLESCRRAMLAPGWEALRAEFGDDKLFALTAWIRHAGKVREACNEFGA